MNRCSGDGQFYSCMVNSLKNNIEIINKNKLLQKTGMNGSSKQLGQLSQADTA